MALEPRRTLTLNFWGPDYRYAGETRDCFYLTAADLAQFTRAVNPPAIFSGYPENVYTKDGVYWLTYAGSSICRTQVPVTNPIADPPVALPKVEAPKPRTTTAAGCRGCKTPGAIVAGADAPIVGRTVPQLRMPIASPGPIAPLRPPAPAICWPCILAALLAGMLIVSGD